MVDGRVASTPAIPIPQHVSGEEQRPTPQHLSGESGESHKGLCGSKCCRGVQALSPGDRLCKRLRKRALRYVPEAARSSIIRQGVAKDNNLGRLGSSQLRQGQRAQHRSGSPLQCCAPVCMFAPTPRVFPVHLWRGAAPAQRLISSAGAAKMHKGRYAVRAPQSTLSSSYSHYRVLLTAAHGALSDAQALLVFQIAYTKMIAWTERWTGSWCRLRCVLRGCRTLISCGWDSLSRSHRRFLRLL